MWYVENIRIINYSIKRFFILVTLINVNPGPNGKCPDNAQNSSSGLCACNDGYRVTIDNRTCGKIIHNCLLIE
jgi:hypothetical protein